MTQYVYFFGGGTADGNKDMKDTARRQGRRPGRDDQRRACRCRPGFTISTAGLQRLLRERQASCRPRSTSRSTRPSRSSRRCMGKKLGDRRRSAAGLGALRREVLHARHDEHHPEPGPERPVGRGPGGQDRQPALRLGLLPPLHPDVRQRRARASRRTSSSTSSTRGQEEVRREGRHRPRREGARRGDRPLQGGGAEGDAASPSRRSRARSSWAPATPSSSPGEPARDHLPQAEQDPARPRHRRQRADDGVRQHGRHLGHGRRLHPQPLDRREGVLRRVPAERAGRGRRGRHPHPAPDHRPREG